MEKSEKFKDYILGLPIDTINKTLEENAERVAVSYPFQCINTSL